MYDEYNFSKKNKGNGKKRISKRDVSKTKVSKYVKKNLEVVFDDIELLRIQGLMRCILCKTPFPLSDTVCPTCEGSV